VSTSEGEKAAAALQKTSCKAKDLQVTLNLLLSVKMEKVVMELEVKNDKLKHIPEANRITNIKNCKLNCVNIKHKLSEFCDN